MNKISIELKSVIGFMGIKIFAESINFLTPIIIAFVLAPDFFGAFSLLKMIIFLGIAIFVGPVLSPFEIESNKEYLETNKSNKTFTSTIIYLSISIIIFFLLFTLFGRYLIEFSKLSYEQFKVIFIFAFIGLSIKSFASSFFIGLDKKTAHILVELVYSITFLIYIFSIYISNNFTLQNIFLGYFFSMLPLVLIFYFYLDYRILPISFSKRNFILITNFAFWSILGYSAAYLSNWGDNLILSHYVSLTEIGIYNFAYQIFKGIIMISFMINTYYNPFISKNIHNKEIIFNYINYKRRLFLSFIIPLLIIFGILINLIITMFLDKGYYQSIIIIQILLIANVIAFYLAFKFPIFNVTKNYKSVQVLLSIQVTINLILDFLLIPHIGIKGAAVATVSAYIIYGLLTELKFRKIIKNLYV